MYNGEKFNAITHLIGAVLALAGTVVLIFLSTSDGDAWKVVSASIYGTSLVLLYSFSTLYHSLRGRAKDILRAVDHQRRTGSERTGSVPTTGHDLICDVAPCFNLYR